MKIKLYDHNQKAYLSVINQLDSVGKTAVIHPTGSGKSYIAFKLAEDNPKDSMLWLSPSDYIFEIQLANLAKDAPDVKLNNISFMTYAKLMNADIDQIVYSNYSYIVLDEFHRCGAEGWGKGVIRLIETLSGAKILGLSATHIRYLDNQRNMAEELFDNNIASYITLGEAIATGIIKAPTYVRAMYSYDEEIEKYHKWIQETKSRGCKSKAVKYLEELKRSLGKANRLEELFSKYMDNPSGKYLVFCSNVRHLDEMISHVHEWFSVVNEDIDIYKVSFREPESRAIFSNYNSSCGPSLKLLFSVDMLNEGIHVVDVDGVILFRPTVSPIIYKQQIGRALSSSASKKPLIIDVVNNYEGLMSVASIQDEITEAAERYAREGREKKIIIDNFMIIDEASDSIKLFEILDSMLSSSWEMYYEEAKKYYEKNGNLDMAQKYKTDEGLSLGSWVYTQRRIHEGKAQGYLSEEKISMLEQIGMVWGIGIELRWNEKYELAKNYYEENGHLNMLVSHITKEGAHLGAWIAQQRKMKKAGKLSYEKIQKLEKIGMIWDVKLQTFEQFYMAASKYAEMHGTCNANLHYVTDDGIKLGIWISTQRVRYREGHLSEYEIAALERLSINWGQTLDDKWNVGIEHAREYYREYGDINIRKNVVMPDGFKLGKWIELQKRYYTQGILQKERIKDLEELQIVWKQRSHWNLMFDEAEKYYNSHGSLSMKRNYHTEAGLALGIWIGTQKTHKDKLSAEQIRKLNNIGMDWMSIPDRKWENNYKEVLEYYEENGDINKLPSWLYSKTGVNLASWIRTQRGQYRKGKLSADRVAKLEEMNIMW